MTPVTAPVERFAETRNDTTDGQVAQRRKRNAVSRKPTSAQQRPASIEPTGRADSAARSIVSANAVTHRLTVTETRSRRGAVIKLESDQIVAAKLIVGHRAATWYIERAEILGELVDLKGTFPTYEDAAGYARRECERIRTDIAGGADGVRCQS